jgi:protein-tyrosine-phosphatase
VAFTVTFICTGNRFRSAIGAAVLRAATAGLPVHVASLGTLRLGPLPALPEALEYASRHGLELSSHRAACVAGRDLSGADLVIGFDRAHVGAAILDADAPRDRSFLLTELARLLETVDAPPEPDVVSRARRLVERAHEARQSWDPGAFPVIPDPLGGPHRGYREVGDRVRELSLDLASALFGPAAASRSRRLA